MFDLRSNTDFALDSLEQVSLDAGVSQTSWACIEAGLRSGGYVDGLDTALDGLDPEAIDMLAVSGSGFGELPPELLHLLEGWATYLLDPTQGCLSPQEVAAVSFQAPEGAAMDLGSDPGLDRLHAGCIAGAMADCDMLYMTSPPGSDYESTAESCGGANDPIDFNQTHCMAHHDEFVKLSDLAADCTAGFFPACDLLYAISPNGSTFEQTALTCGGHRDAGPHNDCFFMYGHGSRS